MGFKATVNDVVENPNILQFRELEAAQLPRSLADVDLAVITMNYVMSSGMDVKKQGLFWEADDEPLAVMVLAAREKDKDKPEYKKIAEIFHSAAVKNSLKTNSREPLFLPNKLGAAAWLRPFLSPGKLSKK